MSYCNTVWATLERWSQIAFLAAGGLFVLPAVASGFEAATGTGIDVSPAVIYLFLLVVFVGLLGLYPELAERGSAVALGGVSVLAATAAIIVSTLGVTALPLGLTIGESTGMAIIVTIVVRSILTVTTFGVASLRTGAHPRPVGGFLLVAGAAMSLMVAAMLLFGHESPVWVSFIVNGLVAMSLGASGYTLRSVDVPADNRASTGGLVTN